MEAAIGSLQYDGVADCSAILVVTVTEAATTTTSTATSTETLTRIDSAEETELFTVTVTEVAETETELFTVGATTTVTTETVTITESEIVSTVATNFETLTTITTTVENYQSEVLRRRAAATETPVPEDYQLPDYAADVCGSWTDYVKACRCAGVKPSTTTITAAVETATTTTTVTRTADEAITTLVSVVSSTETQTVFQTETVSATETVVTPVAATTSTTATVTTTETQTETVAVRATSTVALACQPTGIRFRASNPFPDSSTRWMNTVNNALIAWQSFAANPTASALATSTWILNNRGQLQLASPLNNAPEVLAAYTTATSVTSSIQVLMKPLSEVEAGVASGIYTRVTGCQTAGSGVLLLSGEDGRRNMVSCGNALYLSRGNGGDIRSDCVQLTPATVNV